MTDQSDSHALRELARLFLRLGATAFGGPAAHVALMEHEVVRRRGWLTREAFLDLLGAANLIPGPNSTELALYIGQRRAGWRGLLVAGTCFVVPAVVIVLGIGWAYVHWHKLPQAERILYGVKPVIIAIVLQALWALGRTAIKTWSLGALALAAVALSLGGVNELVLLGTAGALLAVIRARRAPTRAGRAPSMPASAMPARAGAEATASEAAAAERCSAEDRLKVPGPAQDGQETGKERKSPGVASVAPWAGIAGLFSGAGVGVGAGAATVTVPFSLSALFFFFLKVGAVLYGSGYVLLAFLRADLVERWHWLSEPQLLDAIAVGQITPGPLFTTATFIGYLLGGLPGGLVATAGIFLPAFVFVALSGPLIPTLRASPVAGAFLDGVNVASLALMAHVTARLAVTALVDVPSVLVAGLSLVLLFRWRLNSLWLLLVGGLVGWVGMK
jgi:chromate transporter